MKFLLWFFAVILFIPAISNGNFILLFVSITLAFFAYRYKSISSSNSVYKSNWHPCECGSKKWVYIESYVSGKQVWNCDKCGNRITNEPPEYWD